MWWKLNHFLSNINFTETLGCLLDNDLLGSLYNQYPDEYKFLVDDIFKYAKNHLLEDVYYDNQGRVKVNRNK